VCKNQSLHQVSITHSFPISSFDAGVVEAQAEVAVSLSKLVVPCHDIPGKFCLIELNMQHMLTWQLPTQI
jgi:hypothetical protein